MSLSSVDNLPHNLILVTIAAVSLGLRLHQIDSPQHVCWDEVHFGKYASYYINKTLFFDVHPPLGKIILAFVGRMTGYDGKFPFNKPGDSLERVHYVGMRQASALFGAAVVPLSSAIVWELSSSLTAMLLTSVLVMSDTALTVMSRFILLDSFLLFFIFLSCYLYVKHSKSPAFERQWWLYLCGCGVALACSLGVKLVGVFVIAHIGLCVIKRLWAMANQKEIPLEKFVQHVVARIYTLICVPIFVYCIIFVIHFVTLRKSGVGDGFHSSAFQSTIDGNPLYHINIPQYIAYGSEITLKNYRPNGGYLHSHPFMYPHNTAIQQVTTYGLRDLNNRWIVVPEDSEDWTTERSSVVFVKDGDLIRLKHTQTHKYLHSDDKSSAMTKIHNEVGAYSASQVSPDENNLFRIKVTSGLQDEGRITPIHTVLQLVHQTQDCSLESRGKKLPAWGQEQKEVTCNPDKIVTSSSQWNVEEVFDSRLPNIRLDWKHSKPGFLFKLMETHTLMVSNNRDLRPKADTEFISRPWMWPIAHRGQLFSVEPHILMLGNPATHWMILVLAVPVFIVFLCDMVKQQRSKAYHTNPSIEDMAIQNTYSSLGFLLSGYAMHYLPFYPMTRVLYAHHYLPAYVFSAMFTGMSVDHLLRRLAASSLIGKVLSCSIYGTLCSVSLLSFYILSPIVYGYDSDAEDNPMTFYKLNDYWDF
ncbi:protein O-mannosyl-transferase 2-like [Watersipora subatra]|uniref:protein O-mannosyl-transferase 2-like n=1 Tax=Watersipora subatra TaxID=2589382 RepID=UPI00355C511A